jgi:hypothetical protein
MFKQLLLMLSFSVASHLLAQPCNTTNAAGCSCEDGSDECDLLPDIDISWWAILNYANGPSEFPQVCNPPCNGNDARLRVTGSTPNVGFGSFTVLGSNYYVCGTDTFQSSNPGNCPNGTPPRNLILQRIYQKSGNLMSYYDRWSGAMTYHPTHNHNHVDDWCVFTLRIKDDNEPDPRKWDIVGKGAKIGFCLMDYGSCSTYPNHCRTDNTVHLGGTSMNNQSFPNFGLGGGQYNCSPVIQGISSGYTDIYSKSLDMMWIDIPPDICNGDYWIVVEVDPLNHFLESNEDNNYTAVPYTLTQQNEPGNAVAKIYADKPNQICFGDSIELTAKAGLSYQWSNGATTQKITVHEPGEYTVTITDFCGTATSEPFVLVVAGFNDAPLTIADTLCGSGSATLIAEGDPELIEWYNAPIGGTLLHVGNTYQTPTLNQTTTYYVQSVTEVSGPEYKVGPSNTNLCGGNFSSNNQWLIFDVETPFTLKSVLVNANSEGMRTITVKNDFQAVVATASVMIPEGLSRVDLNFEIPVGTNFTIEANANPGLFRNQDCATYPYEVPGVLSIKNSSGGNRFYYYYYDWEIQLPNSMCMGERIPVTAVVNVIEQGQITNLPEYVDVTDSPLTLTGLPAGGTFSGPGVVNGVFDPAIAGVGGPYIITYIFIDANGCSNNTEAQISVETSVNIAGIESDKPMLQLFPNPNNGDFQLRFETKKAHRINIQIFDELGRSVYTEQIQPLKGEFVKTFQSGEIASGIYTLRLLVDQTPYTKKMVIH